MCACMCISTSACLSACLCPVLMLHFGKRDSFSVIMIQVLISTVLLVILNYVFMLCTKPIYFLLYNQNGSVTVWLNPGNFKFFFGISSKGRTDFVQIKDHLKIQGARNVTWNKAHTGRPQILGTIIQKFSCHCNLVCTPVFCQFPLKHL